MKKIMKYFYIAVIALFLNACASDYLDTTPTASIGTPTVFETTENAKLAINGIAKLMTRQYLSSQGFNGEGTIKMYYGNYSGNHFFVNLPGWAAIINSQYNENTASIYLYYPWYYYYMIIGNANAIIVNIDQAEGPDSDKQFIKAQALTYRAYSFMMLAQIYAYRWKDSNNGASDGLVLRIDQSDGDMPLSTLKDTYDRIYTDLNEAISLYRESEKDRASGDNYSPSINVAYATYARAALNREDYETAENYAILARGGYPLMSVADYKNGFCNPTSEWIWSCYGSSDETLYYYSYFAYIAYTSNASAVRTYPKCISRRLYDQIPETDIRRDLFLDPKEDPYTTSTGRAASGALYNRAFATYPDIDAAAHIYAYMQFKVKANDNPGVGHLNNFRSSEMYLIEAEAKYFRNNIAGAQEALNELTADSGRDPQYNCTATGGDLLDEIKRYRAIELWGEGFDWFDYKRWGDRIVRHEYAVGGNFIPALATTINPEENNKWTWRIPLRETDYNKAIGGALPEN
ncbi:MAG: RagB/SusD family nutrient uptake outer membrane protein [Tannerella sp.]|jgi:hypothetical protein|nr:RagB/SusD family nutrient uptake outer membrane protein [Tannerella sp.]